MVSDRVYHLNCLLEQIKSDQTQTKCRLRLSDPGADPGSGGSSPHSFLKINKKTFHILKINGLFFYICNFPNISFTCSPLKLNFLPLIWPVYDPYKLPVRGGLGCRGSQVNWGSVTWKRGLVERGSLEVETQSTFTCLLNWPLSTRLHLLTCRSRLFAPHLNHTNHICIGFASRIILICMVIHIHVIMTIQMAKIAWSARLSWSNASKVLSILLAYGQGRAIIWLKEVDDVHLSTKEWLLFYWCHWLEGWKKWNIHHQTVHLCLAPEWQWGDLCYRDWTLEQIPITLSASWPGRPF